MCDMNIKFSNDYEFVSHSSQQIVSKKRNEDEKSRRFLILNSFLAYPKDILNFHVTHTTHRAHKKVEEESHLSETFGLD